MRRVTCCGGRGTGLRSCPQGPLLLGIKCEFTFPCLQLIYMTRINYIWRFCNRVSNKKYSETGQMGSLSWSSLSRRDNWSEAGRVQIPGTPFLPVFHLFRMILYPEGDAESFEDNIFVPLHCHLLFDLLFPQLINMQRIGLELVH